MVPSSTERTSRLAAKASQMMNKNIITAVREMREPKDDTVFQRV